ncbi:MAG: prephenate dehydratase [Desulfovibrionaceae bacterium]|jgi:chorismate mutase/prephenate dehydratase|nr:prephenate dehydratase [Desulfovibrionaceae bacterium]
MGANATDDPGKRLLAIRDAIDGVDRDLVRLLGERAALSAEVGRIKAGSRDVIFKPFREKEVFEKLLAANGPELPAEHLRSIYREIFSSSRALQRPQRIAYLGPEGTFSYFAGVQFFGHIADYKPMNDLHGVFQAVSAREADLGVIPLENSLQGTVGQSLDLFLRFDVFIQSELFFRISHSAMANVGRLSEVKKVYSHPQPLAQCGAWLRDRLPAAAIIPTESTAAAARRVAEETEGAVAIGNQQLAPMHGLTVLARAIEDQKDNWTRFVVVGPVPADQQARDKTSILFTLPDKPGSLSRVLEVFAGEHINMKKLESRPLLGEKWKYVFFVDLECDLKEERYSRALRRMGEVCHTLRILGSYPAGPSLDATAAEES